MCWINMNKNYLVIGCAGFTVLAVSAGAGPSRSLETGRAEKRQGAKARTFVNQAEQDARAKISSREVEQKALLGAMQKLKLAVEAKKVDDILAGKLVEVLSRRVKQGTMSRMQAAEAIKYLIANNKVNVTLE